MQLILREDVDNVGKAGEIISVKDGYGRNYLLPRGLAYLATEGNKKRVAAEAGRHLAKDAEREAEAEVVAAKLAGVDLTFSVQAGEGDKLFGSVTAADIAAKLAEAGITIDKRIIELPEPIKLIGVTMVPIRLHSAVRPEVRVWVVKA